MSDSMDSAQQTQKDKLLAADVLQEEPVDDEGESKYDGYDEEDPMLDEMLQKAEQLRLAMLAASPNFKDTKGAFVPIPSSNNSQRSKVSLARSKNSMPTIPETIEMATDNATECSSVGYYSIVYSSNPKNHTKKAPSRNTTIQVKQVLEEEEEKTNEDGSVHRAFSDSEDVPRRQHPVLAPATAPFTQNNCKEQDPGDTSPKSCVSQPVLSPLAIAPPDDDEIVSVKDYHNPCKSKRDQCNGDDVTWVKVDFVDQQDEDYVPLQDYSRQMLAATSAELSPRRLRKQRRKVFTFGLCCIILVSLWMQMPREKSQHQPSMESPAPYGQVKTIAAEIEARTVVKEQQKPIVSVLIPPVAQPKRVVFEPPKTDRAQDELKSEQAALVVALNPPAPFVSTSQYKGGALRVLFAFEQPRRLVWENNAEDRQSILENFSALQ